MTGIVDWAADHARMVLAFIAMSLVIGGAAYMGLPKEGEPDIEIPAAFISVPFQGISAEDSETLLVKVIETEMSDLDGLKKMRGTAAEGYASVVLEFEFGWDKDATLADIRAAMDKAEAKFPAGADSYTVGEFNFSEFPIIIVNLTGNLPERTLMQVANQLQDRLEGLEPVLEVTLAGNRDEMVEVTIDPLRLESYNVTAAELINVVVNNNQLIAAGQIDSSQGSFAVKIPSSFDDTRDIYDLPVKRNGDRVITLGDLAEINLTFEDREGTARFNGEPTAALQVSKRKGYNLIDTAALVRQVVEEEKQNWPPELREAIIVGASNDQSFIVSSMVGQLEGSVLTAICLVMIVVLASLGLRPALLVGFAIPTSFLLCFAFLAVMGISVSNIVMFGLILAVGMLVDGAIVVVEYADKKMDEGEGPMRAYVEAAKRMFWPIVSSTATTLCAFLPMLFWPGVPGQFMGMLPVTLIFVLSASLVVALIYLPVMGGVSGRLVRVFEHGTEALKAFPWLIRAALVPAAIYGLFKGSLGTLNPDTLFGGSPMIGMGLFLVSAMVMSMAYGSIRPQRRAKRIRAGHRRTLFGRFIKFIAGNPIMPIVSVAGVIAFVMAVFAYFGENNKGVEFFVESEPEQAIIYVQARGNLSLDEKDALVREVEDVILATDGVDSAFAFAGAGGLNANTGGASGPRDTIGQVQIELVPWDERPRVTETIQIPIGFGDLTFFNLPFDVTEVDPRYDGDVVLARLEENLSVIPGIRTEVFNLSRGPASGKPVHLRLSGDDFDALKDSVAIVNEKFAATPGLIELEDTLPLPGIDWEINVDVEAAGRYGADVATVGGMVQLVTRGILLDTMRVDTSDEEIDIRVRLPDEYRVLSTLDTLKVRTPDGLVPLSNFVTREPVRKLAQIDRFGGQRIFEVKANVSDGLSKVVLDDETVAIVRALDAGETVSGSFTDSTGVSYVVQSADDPGLAAQAVIDGTANLVPINANERIAALTEWLENDRPLPAGIDWEWTGDQEEQAESQAFLGSAFGAALGLMFVILLAQFNSFYNSLLVLLAVVLSTTGVLIGMLVMDQTFSIIMTGTGIVALAGIVVNNNIVLIDTYQEYSRYMPRIEAIIRTAEARIRPVLLTTITTMAGLAPMMFGLSLNFFDGGYSVDSPTALWWKQLATAVVFGLGIATVLTLVFTPSMLALRVWATTYVLWIARALAALSFGRSSKAARDWALQRQARRVRQPELQWDTLLDAPSARVMPAGAAALAPEAGDILLADTATSEEAAPAQTAEASQDASVADAAEEAAKTAADDAADATPEAPSNVAQIVSDEVTGSDDGDNPDPQSPMPSKPLRAAE